jgi:hypothetical protein
VISLRQRLETLYKRLPPSTIPLFIIVLAVLAGNAMYVLRLANNDPISWTAGISHQLCRVTCGRPMIDPNVGFITQPMGHLAAMDLLHGHLPFWNYFEGLGSPLAGEMQSAALFPLTLLFALSSGLVWFHVVLEVIAGVSTYFLARRLSLPAALATGAGVVFAFNGTFAWLGNAVLNPVAFLPMLLLGVEMIFDRARQNARGGWYVAAIALALSMYAGFPEVAYLDGLMVAGWTIVRFFSVPRVARAVAARRVGLAALVGFALSLPILVPFYDFMKVANVGSHVSQVDGLARLSPIAGRMLLDPYIYGTLFSNHNSYPGWGGIGGYLSAGVGCLALLGLFGARHRALRIYLGAWIALGLLGAFVMLHVRQLWNLLPGVHTIAVSRYIFPSLEMAAIILAALGLWDLATTARAKRLFFVTTAAGLGLLAWSALSAGSVNNGDVLTHRARVIFMGLHALPFIAVGLLLVLGFFTRYRIAPVLMAVVLGGEALLLFFVPTAEAPKQITLDEAPIAYLQQHQGHYRFLDFAVLYPNWGSQYGLNELSQVDLPFPRAYANFITSSLMPGLSPPNQFTIHSGMYGIIQQEKAVLAHFQTYEDASVKYLLVPNSVVMLPGFAQRGVTRVFEDSLAAIYQMPSPRPFISAASASCTVTTVAVDQASVSCPQGASSVVRTELSMDGWRAYVNGQPAEITTLDGVYQSVAVPRGASTLTYKFFPPHERYALLAALIAALFLIGAWVQERWRLFRR